jgi:hypothetical protein
VIKINSSWICALLLMAPAGEHVSAQTLFTVTNTNYAGITEGNVGPTTATVTVMLSAAASRVVTANYQSANATAASTGDHDDGNLTRAFAIGETTATVSITINGDTTKPSWQTSAAHSMRGSPWSAPA